MVKFIFDLDGTITSEETLPLIAKHFGVEAEISELTHATIAGNVPFIESFIKRVHILGGLPVDEIATLLEGVKVYQKVVEFIQTNEAQCIIATGNLDCWIKGLVAKLGCRYYCSDGIIENGKVKKLTNILEKEKVVAYHKSLGTKVVFIGDGNNDIEAMRLADVSIATALTHRPASGVLAVADYIFFSEEALCRQLNQLRLAAHK